MLQGFLRTPKIHEFNQLVAYLAQRRKKSLVKVPALGIDNSPLGGNYWLSGFIDADGGFKIRADGTRIECRFAIEQLQYHRITNYPYEPLFSQIAHMLQVRLNRSTHHGRKYWRIESTGIKKLNILVDYLDSYPLMSSKLLDYQDWRRAHQLMVEGRHLTSAGRCKIVSLKSNINNKRTCFDWNHIK